MLLQYYMNKFPHLQLLKRSDCRSPFRLTNKIGHLALACLLAVSQLALSESEETPELLPVVGVCEALIGVDGPATGRASSFVDIEIQRLLKRVENDPTLKKTIHTIEAVMASGSPLAAELRRPSSGETQFLTGYLRWVIHRMDKGKVPGKEDQKAAADLGEPGLQRTNVIEIFDIMVQQLIQLNEPIPKPILRLLFEGLQGGVERTDMAAGLTLLVDRLSELVDTLEFLKTDPELNREQILKGFLILAELDGGAPYAIQQTRREFTEEEKLYFRELDPDSPLLYPSRHYSKRERDQLAKAYPDLKAFEITGEMADEILGNESRSGKRVRYPKAPLAYLPHDKPEHEKLEPGTEIVPAEGSHPIAVALSAGLAMEDFENIRSQMDLFAVATERMEKALVERSGEDVYPVAVDTYRVFVNMGIYSPNLLAQSEGLVEVLATATVEVGGPEEMKQFLQYMEWRHFKIKELHYHSHLLYGKYYRKAVEAVRHYILQQPQWSKEKLNAVFQILEKLSDVEDANKVSEDEADIVFQDITTIRLAESMGDDMPDVSRPIKQKFPTKELDLFLDHAKASRATLNIGHYNVSMRKYEFHFISSVENGSALTLTKIDSRQIGSGEYQEFLETIEQAARAKGFKILILEGVDNPRLWEFYQRLGYKTDDIAKQLKTFFKVLN